MIAHVSVAAPHEPAPQHAEEASRLAVGHHVADDNPPFFALRRQGGQVVPAHKAHHVVRNLYPHPRHEDASDNGRLRQWRLLVPAHAEILRGVNKPDIQSISSFVVGRNAADISVRKLASPVLRVTGRNSLDAIIAAGAGTFTGASLTGAGRAV